MNSEKLNTEKDPYKKKWFALYVNSRAEKKVMENLCSIGIEAYVPLQKTLRQWSDRKKTVTLPLLNGYVFVRTTLENSEIILGTKGVINFVRSAGKIAVIREDEILRLKQLIDLGYQIEVCDNDKSFSKDDKIKIASGPLKNIEGFVLENKEGRFIEVLLESIGQSIRVKLPKEILIHS